MGLGKSRLGKLGGDGLGLGLADAALLLDNLAAHASLSLCGRGERGIAAPTQPRLLSLLPSALPLAFRPPPIHAGRPLTPSSPPWPQSPDCIPPQQDAFGAH